MDLDIIWNQLDEYKKSCNTIEENNKENNFVNNDYKKCDCEEYSDDNIFKDLLSGYYICTECGIVVESKLIDTSGNSFVDINATSIKDKYANISHTTFNDDPDNLFKSSKFHTYINYNNKYSFFNKSKKYYEKLEASKIPYDEKVFYKLKNELTSRLGNDYPSHVIYQSVVNFKNLLFDKKNKIIHRGKIKNGIIAVCVYHSCKQYNLDRSPDEIIKYFSITKHNFNECCKIYMEKINNVMKVSNSSDFIERYCNKLNFDYKITKLTKKIIDTLNELYILSNCTPQSILASVMYFVILELNLDIDKKEIASLYSISEITIVKNYKIIINNKQIIFKHIKDNVNS